MSGPYVDFDTLAEQIGERDLARALDIERHGRGWRCPFPEHHENGDKDPSFHIYPYEGRIYAKCHTSNEAYSPVGLAAEVWGCGQREAAVRLARKAGLSHLIDRSGSNGGSSEGPDIYTYSDEDGEPVFRVLRFSGKKFAQQGRQGESWKNGMDGVRRVPYRLPEVLEAVDRGDPVYMVEGERDVHAVEDVGHVATCNPGGAGNWKEEFNEHFEGGDIRVVADDDRAGRDHARRVARSLEDVAENVELLKPAEGSDVEDHLDAGYTLDELKQLGGS